MSMSCSNSSLSEGQYGYDFVVATTQESINGTMLNFLDHLTDNLVETAYILDANGKYVTVPLAKVIQGTGVDPFVIPDGVENPDKNEKITALRNGRFVCALRARVGLPAGSGDTPLPDLVTLNQNVSQVVFRAMCAQFEVTAIQANVYGPLLSWVHKTQDPSKPWIFVADVKLANSIMDDQAIRRLPQDVQDKINQTRQSAPFEMRQLLFDLATAAQRTVPDIQGLDPNSPIRALLQNAFMPAYIEVLRRQGDPLLSAMGVVKTATPPPRTVTDLKLMVNPYMSNIGMPLPEPTTQEMKCTSLNYLCAVDGHQPRQPALFHWNWVDEKDLGDHDGVVAVNRVWLANALAAALTPTVRNACRLPRVDCNTTRSGSVDYRSNFDKCVADLDPPKCDELPALNFFEAPNPVMLEYCHTAKDEGQCGSGGCLGQFSITFDYTVTVSFLGDRLKLEQYQRLHVFIQRLQTNIRGDYIKRSRTDWYSIGAAADGSLVAKLETTDPMDDKSDGIPDKKPPAPGEPIRTAVRKLNEKAPLETGTGVETVIGNAVLSFADGFVFPSGKKFFYKQAAFSGCQDLVAAISYREPGADVIKMSNPHNHHHHHHHQHHHHQNHHRNGSVV